MSQNLKNHAACLRHLHKLSGVAQKRALKKALLDPTFVKCICECSSNIIYGSVRLNKNQKKKLASRKRTLRLLAKEDKFKEKTTLDTDWRILVSNLRSYHFSSQWAL